MLSKLLGERTYIIKFTAATDPVTCLQSAILSTCLIGHGREHGASHGQ
jgi:hypothetical protein